MTPPRPRPLTDAERLEVLRRLPRPPAGPPPLRAGRPPDLVPPRLPPPTRLDLRPAATRDRADAAGPPTSYVPVRGSLTGSDYVDPVDDPAGDEPRIRHDGLGTLVTLVALLVALTLVALLVLG